MPYKDPAKQKAAQRRHYDANKSRVLSRSGQRVRETRDWLNGLKAKMSCAHCPENDPVCLDFHHTDPAEKDMGVSDMIKLMSRSKIEAEIAKCLVLCSNCHRKEHRRLRLEDGQ